MNINVTDIKNLSQADVFDLAFEKFSCKGHDCYIADFGQDIGTSVIVFKNNHQLFHANEYQFCHPNMDKTALISFYKKNCKKVLFSNTELLADVKGYDDYILKSNYIRNILSQAYDHLFGDAFSSNKKCDITHKLIESKFKYFSNVAFAFYSSPEYVDYASSIISHLDKCFDVNKYRANKFRKMIRQELYDSEGDYHGALGNCGVDESNLTAEEARIIDEELSRCRYEIKYF